MKRFNGFTLAEVLITLAIVGVVAAMTIPNIVTYINEKIKTNKIKVIEQKLNQGLDLMQVNRGFVTKYTTTLDFVNELSKYMKFIEICSPNSAGGNSTPLSKCWTYNKINTLPAGREYNVDSLTTGARAFKQYHSGHKEVVGVLLKDGTPMLLSYDNECELLDPDTKYPDGKALSCISGVYDINARSGANRYGDDIVSFNSTGFANSCVVLAGGTCFYGMVRSKTPLTMAECNAIKGKYGISGCPTNTDYWANAVKQCRGADHLPTQAQLTAIAKEIYGTDSINGGITNGLKMDKNSTAYKMLTQGGTATFILFSRAHYKDIANVYNRAFWATSTEYTNWHNRTRSYKTVSKAQTIGLCVD